MTLSGPPFIMDVSEAVCVEPSEVSEVLNDVCKMASLPAHSTIILLATEFEMDDWIEYNLYHSYGVN